MVDSWFVGRIYSLRQTLKPDEKLIIRYGAVVEVAKKTRWELLKDKVMNYALCKIR